MAGLSRAPESQCEGPPYTSSCFRYNLRGPRVRLAGIAQVTENAMECGEMTHETRSDRILARLGYRARMARPAWSRRSLLKVAGGLAFGALIAACKRSREPLPVLGQVGDFALVDENGASVRGSSLRGKVWVADFFFTRCPTICPRITRRMRALQVAAAGQVDVTLVSFSVDPENDTPPALLAYAHKYEADLRNWTFLTGELEVVKKTVIDGFKLALDGKSEPGAENGGIIHGSHLVLVDRTLVIRGYYRSDDDDEMKRLIADAGSL